MRMSYDSKEITCPECQSKTVIEPHSMDCDNCGYDIEAHQKQYAERRRSVQGDIRNVVVDYDEFTLVGTNLSNGCVRVNLRADGAMFMDMDSVADGGEIDESIFDRQETLAKLKSEIREIADTGMIEVWDTQKDPSRGSRFGVVPDMSYADSSELTLLVGTQ